MKAAMLRRVGDEASLEIMQVPDPMPASGEVCVRLKSAALNRRDLSICKRRSSQSMLPLIPGSDGAGVVAARGMGVNNWAVGQAVIIYPALNWGASARCAGPRFRILGGPDHGTFAEKVNIPAENLFLKPENLSFQQAAACPVGLLTAWRALLTLAAVRPGDRVLLPGIGSGVATFALQIAKSCGAFVVVSSSSEDKLRRALAMGADGGVNYRTPEWAEKAGEMTGGAGFDIILDSVGRPTFGPGLDLLAPGGRMITFGATAGAAVECSVRQLYSRHLQILGTTLGSPGEFEVALRFLATGQVKPVIDAVFELNDINRALERLEVGRQFGKIVVEIP